MKATHPNQAKGWCLLQLAWKQKLFIVCTLHPGSELTFCQCITFALEALVKQAYPEACKAVEQCNVSILVSPLLPVMEGTLLGLLRMSNMMGFCTQGTMKCVPSPTTFCFTPANLSNMTARCPPSTVKSNQNRRFILAVILNPMPCAQQRTLQNLPEAPKFATHDEVMLQLMCETKYSTATVCFIRI